VNYLFKFGMNMFMAYQELAMFLDDLKAVHPPPKEDQDDKKDLFSVFHQFFMTIAKVRAEVQEQKLDQDVKQSFGIKLPYTDGVCAPLPSAVATPASGSHDAATKVESFMACAAVAPQTATDAPVMGVFPASSSVGVDTNAVQSLHRLESESREPTTELPPVNNAGAPCSPKHTAETAARALLKGSPEPIKRQLEVNWSLSEPSAQAPCEASSPQPSSVAMVQPPLGPPPSRPAKRLSACPRPHVWVNATADFSESEAGNSLPSSGAAVLGAPPLSMPSPSLSCQTSTEVAASSPMPGERTQTPSSPSWRATRVFRKSLTRIANTITSQAMRALGDSPDSEVLCTPRRNSGISSPREESSPASYHTGSENGDGNLEGAGPDLQAQIWKEMRRRKSRGKPTVPLSWPGPPIDGPWEDMDDCDSPQTPNVRCYCLTPVNEQGETPYRLDDSGRQGLGVTPTAC